MTIHFETDGPVAIVSIDRPERRNAVDREAAEALHAAFNRFEADETLSVAVLTGRGGTFCAGADLKAVAEGRGNRVGREEQGPMGPTYLRLSKPVIAAIEGYAVAGGIELALWSDLRVMAEGATFGVFCRRFGVPLVDGGTVRLARLIGQSRAMDLVLTGRPVGSAEALAFGLANRVVPDGGALTAAVELAKEIAGFPQTCMRHDRLSMLEQWGMDEAAALANEAQHGQMTIASGETRAGAERFRAGEGRGGSFAR